MSKSMTTKTEGGALAIPEDMIPQGAGLENTDQDSFATPFLRLLQKMSDQCDEDKDNYIEGARPGMLYDTVSGEVIDPTKEEVRLIPVGYRRVFVEWVPRGETDPDGKSGFVEEFDVLQGEALMQTTTVNDKGRDMLPNGHELVDTRIHYVIVVRADGTFYPGVINMERTQVKRSRRWLTDMNKQVSARKLRATCQLTYKAGAETQQKGENTWKIWDIKEPQPVTDQDQLDAAIAFYKAFQSGAVSSIDDTEATTSTEAPSDSAGTVEPEVQEAASF